jgi:membrane protein
MSTTQVKTFIISFIWDDDLSSLPWWKGWAINALRVAYVAIRDLTEGQITLQAMSLVYTTLLALVPLLAVSFSVLKGFGVHNQIEPILLNFLAPLGEKGVEIGNRIIGFVDNIRAGVLGSVGLALLLYTVISLIQKVEEAFNYTWHIKRIRPLSQRFSDYLSVILIGPVLLFTAIGLKASVMSTAVVKKLMALEPLGSLLSVSTRLVPYLLVIVAFTFVYIFVPYTKVRFRSALTGAVVAGTMWQVTGWGFASFVVSSTRYTVIYSGFAILIMFMIWLYLSWLILLIGASIAYYSQHPECILAQHCGLQLSNRLKEKLSLLVMSLVGQNYYHGLPAWNIETLAQRIGAPTVALEPIIEALEQHGLLAYTSDDPLAFLPAKPLETTNVKEVLDAIRTGKNETDLMTHKLSVDLAVEQLVDHLEESLAEALRGHTLKELALSEPQPLTPTSEQSQQQAGHPSGTCHKV